MKTSLDTDNALGKPEAGEVERAQDEHEYRAHMTRTILFKVDTRVLPVLAMLFLCSFLDRTNVGNAKILGLAEDLHMTNLQYNQGLAVFYATYIARFVLLSLFFLSLFSTNPLTKSPSELPSNLILKRLTPRVWLSFLTCAWGIVTMCLGFVHGYGSFVAVRAVLGLTEGGLLPGMILYLSGLYTRGEMALRIGIFYTATSLSGAFGGLLARGLSAIGPRGGLEGWRWIFIIEGLLTVVCGVVAYFFLATNLATASYLTLEEQDFAIKRLSGDIPSNDRFK